MTHPLSGSPVLTLQGVRMVYRDGARAVTALDGVDLALRPGEFAAVVGPSGAGKSTLLLAAAGLRAPTSGSVHLADRDLYALAPDARAEWRGRQVGFVFQHLELIPYLTALENVLTPTLAQVVPDAETRARTLLTDFGLGPHAHSLVVRLSAGERQRVALARALLLRPRLILADEPTGALDPANADAVVAALRAFTAAGGAVLLVTHDPTLAGATDRRLSLQAGRLAADPNPATVQST